MNTTRVASTTASSPSLRSDNTSSSRREEPHATQRRGEFERVLRRKSGARDDERREGDETTIKPACDGTAAGVSTPATSAPLPARATCVTAAGGERGPAAASATFEAAMNASTQATPAGIGANDTAGAWSVTLNQPLGAPLELRATRNAGAADVQPSWALTIASPAHDAAMLARQVPRLNERLRARDVHHSHVRIESDDGEPL